MQELEKTELAHALSKVTSRRLIRLQCFEGLDHHDAVYEWNYGRQLTEIRLAESKSVCRVGNHLFRRFLN